MGDFTKEYFAAAKRFLHDCEIVDVSPYGEGHINKTLLVTTPDKRYIMQKMNTGIFPDSDGIILAVAAGTQLTRWLPFWLFPEKKQPPAVVAYLGKVLPPAMMGLLVVYCLRSISWLSAPHGAPELIAIAAVAGLHLWKRNVLLSIAGGTVLYMVLVQAVFV